jgi:hypothetical protein
MGEGRDPFRHGINPGGVSRGILIEPMRSRKNREMGPALRRDDGSRGDGRAAIPLNLEIDLVKIPTDHT